MKTKFIFGFILILALTVFTNYAQEFTLTTTATNTVASKSTINIPELSNNPNAIIVATPLGDTAKLNPHPIGAWYYNNKWNIFNTDHATMPAGLKFNLEVFLKPDFNHFLHIVTKANLIGEGSEIDNSALNNNPNAQVKILQNYAPDNRTGFSLNKYEAKATYNSTSGKWYITNVNGNFLSPNTAYNVVVISNVTVGARTSTTPTTPPTPTIATTPNPTVSTTTESTSITLMSPEPPPTKSQTSKSYPLTFDNLNDFVEKGLPNPAPVSFGNIDHVAVVMAQQISKSDEKSLPVLLTALQVAGFSVINENGKILLQPADGVGQGLAVYDFEAVGAIKMAKSEQNMSLEKIAGVITKETPEILGWKLTELMLEDLRLQADNSEDKFLRFWARLIIALGKISAQPVDLMTVTPSNANITMIQATLLIRRLQGDLHLLKTQTPPIGKIRQPFSNRNSSIYVKLAKDDLPFFYSLSQSKITQEPCGMTKEEAYIMGGAQKILTFGNKKVMGMVFGKGAGSATYGKISQGLKGAGLALSWLKLVAAVTSLRGEITVEKPLPLVRTMNSTSGQKRLMKVRIWNEVGKLEMLNCVRKYLNTFAGLDMAMPIDGPLAHKSVEWHFAGDSQTRVNNSEKRNLDKFVDLESPSGKDRSPQKQETDANGESQMYIVGAPKIPAVVYQKNSIKIEKQANVVVGITLKSDKDVGQNTIDLMGLVMTLPGGVAGVATGIMTETGYRLPYAVAFATIPVIDHEECDGQWQGTVTYTKINTAKSKKEKPGSDNGFQKTTSSYISTDNTLTLSGTVMVNSKFGHDSLANGMADEISILDEYSSGKVLCSPKRGFQSFSGRATQTSYGTGNAQGTTWVGIYLDKDSYKISVKPLSIKTTRQTSWSQSAPGNCADKKGESSNSSTPTIYEAVSISGKANYGDDRNILSGSDTTTKDYGNGSKTVETITWNLKRCSK